jgi:hypothetical protein
VRAPLLITGPCWLTYLVVYVFIISGFCAVVTLVSGLLTYLVVYVFILPGIKFCPSMKVEVQVVTVPCWLTASVVSVFHMLGGSGSISYAS